jgi:hypothetical protein
VTTTCLEPVTDAEGFVDMHPRAHHRAVLQAVAKAAADAGDTSAYSLIARQVAAADLEAEFAALAEDASDWAAATFDAGVESWPAE